VHGVDVVISGSSGLIGTALRDTLTADGHRPIALVRRTSRGADEIAWDIDSGVIDAASLEGVDAVVHLAGAGIGDKRWTEGYKRALVTSRTRSTALLTTTLAGLDRSPSRLVSASAIGYYGDRGDEVLTETSEPGTSFLADLCQQWEEATRPAVDAGIPTALIRTGVVLTATGGALAKMLPLFRLGVGGTLGSGRQYWSWITLADQVAAIVHLLEHPEVTGPVNLTGPEPVTNKQFTEALGRVLQRPTLVPVPPFGPKLLLGAEMADALLFDSARVLPTVLETSGFAFEHRQIADGLRAAVIG
jgi:uncharacterized protein (TIGR01777 family)